MLCTSVRRRCAPSRSGRSPRMRVEVHARFDLHQARRRCPRASSRWVCRSLKSMPSSSRRRSSAAMPRAVVVRRRRCRSSSAPSVGELEAELRQVRRACVSSGVCSCSVSCLRPSFCISAALSSTRISSPLLMTPIAVGHLLGFLDVVRGQDDGDAALAQAAHHLPHVAPQLDVDAGASARRGTGSSGSCASALAIITRRFMPPESVMILLLRLSHSDRSRSTCSI